MTVQPFVHDPQASSSNGETFPQGFFINSEAYASEKNV